MKLWTVAETDEPAAQALATGLRLPLPVVRLLLLRGVSAPAEIARFLTPRLSEVSDPFALPEMDKAVDRILTAVDGNEPIAIYGDYDVDGVTGTALLVHVMTALGAQVTPFLPRRLEEGYGLSADGLQRCLETCRPRLIVTVDCGTNSADVVRAATAAGVDVVVTDHHEEAGERSPARALVNPRSAAAEATRDLAGVGVAFKLCHALLKTRRDRRGAAVPELDLKAFLDLVAIGTVADVVPLRGENRILVRHGLACLNRTASPGLKALIEVSAIRKELDTYEIGFMLGPRLNAAGRLACADKALSLLLTKDPAEAVALARELDRANTERRSVEKTIVDEAMAQVDGAFEGSRDFGLVAAGKGWHAGAIGIAASRLVARYGRPAVIIALDGDGPARGSCRGIEGFDLVRALEQCKDLLVTFGGHTMAAGLSIERERVEAFRERFNRTCAETLRDRDLRPALAIDGWLPLGEADPRLMDALDTLRPFGVGNSAPVWATRSVQVVGEPRILKDKHLKLTVASGASQLSAMGWNMAERDVPEGPLDVAYQLERDTYMGRNGVQLILKDFRAAGHPEDSPHPPSASRS